MSRAEIAVTHADDAPAAEPLQRVARGTALGACAATLLGFAAVEAFGPDPVANARAQVLAHSAERAPSVDPAWLDESPAKVARQDAPPRLLAAWHRTPQFMYLCEVNETVLRALWQPGVGLGPDAPREFDTFSMPGGAPHPIFRYPRSTTMPDGLTTNRFGFRGPDVALDKPADTVRIAFVGASATVGNHFLEWSYPEFVGHWLTLWARANDLGVDFEVLNAGRESIQSRDIRAIVEHEVLPLAVDYVVYYEGQNQFGAPSLRRHVEVDGDAGTTPPADLVLDLAAADSLQPHWLDVLCRDVHNARRLRRLLGVHADLPEPPKPQQRLQLPAGLTATDPDLDRAREVLELGTILADLDAMKRACDAQSTRFVMCSFDRLVRDGMRVDLAPAPSVYSRLNGEYWPLSYETIAALDELQNRYFEAWAAARNAPFLDIAAAMPDEPALFTDPVHSTESGVRLRAWVVFTELVRVIEADLAADRVPVPDTEPTPRHPFLQPARRLTAEDLGG